MQHLEVGSLILFGSTLRGSFVLDTVLVVGDEGTKYRTSDGVDYGPEVFQTCTVEPLAARLTHVQKQNSVFTLYTGASRARPVNGMFSFVPCRRVNGDFNQFARPTINLLMIVNPKRWRATGGSKILRPRDEIVQVWNSVARQVEGQGLELGSNLAITPKH